jgi:hypothetical protein
MTTAARCSTAARRRGDSLVGSAAPARRWLLVEHPAGWAPAALDSPGLRGEVGALLHRTALAVGGRVVLIRRPGRARAGEPRLWGVVDVGGAQQWGTWAHADDLRPAVQLLRDGPGPAADAMGPGTPLLLVCTHGRHDVCCAVRGRPVAAALAQRWPEQTWECSHIGGDRFAANLLVVPDGTVYGSLDAASAVDVVARHLAGVVDSSHLRGFSAHPPPVQAALVEVLRVHGPAPADAAVPGTVTRDGDAWVVEVLGSGLLPARAEVRVCREPQPAARLTCRATAEAVAATWVAGLVD